MADESIQYRLVRRAEEDPQWERVVFAEMLIPETPNTHSDYWTREAIREAAYVFMMQGFGIDVNHDNQDRTGQVHVVESFIARKGDPDFIEGSWVVAMKILDDDLWQQVLDGEINGYSYEALNEFFPAELIIEDDGMRQGRTEPDPDDGHEHDFLVIVDENNRVVSGGTGPGGEDEHTHTISTHTITDEGGVNSHKHRYNLVQGKGGK